MLNHAEWLAAGGADCVRTGFAGKSGRPTREALNRIMAAKGYGTAATPRSFAVRGNRPVARQYAPIPEGCGLHPLQMDRESKDEELRELFDWMKQADTDIPNPTGEQRRIRDEVGKRVDLLRWYRG